MSESFKGYPPLEYLFKKVGTAASHCTYCPLPPNERCMLSCNQNYEAVQKERQSEGFTVNDEPTAMGDPTMIGRNKQRFRMIKRLLASCAICTGLATTAHAGAVWDFFETSISCQGNDIGCTLDHNPVAEFVVPSDTSSGSASWLYGFPIFPGDPPPQHDGDDFLLGLRGQEITSQNLTGSITAGGNALKSYDISWDVSAGILNSVHVFYLTGIDEVKLFLTRGSIASDVELGGCVNTQCQVTGVWIDDPPAHTPVPEPVGTASAFLVAGLSWLAARSWGQGIAAQRKAES